MITKKQIDDFSKHFQIDEFTIMREYLQILFLNYLYKEKGADKIFFKGGTAIRLLFGSTRFSEDLDFSVIDTRENIIKLISKLEKSIKKEIGSIKISLLYTGINGLRFRLKYRYPDFKYPLVIRLDFNFIKNVEKEELSPLLTKFPISVFPLINHLSGKEILAEKLCAILTRSKGRDLYDTWFLLEKSVVIDNGLLERKLIERGERYSQKNLINKIKKYSERKLELDLQQFLPKSQRKIIGILKERLEKLLTADSNSLNFF